MVVIDVSEVKMQDHKYFLGLLRHMENGGSEALLHYLMNRDITRFEPGAIPKTGALLAQKINSLDSKSRFIYEMLVKGVNCEGGRWDKSVPKSTVYGLYLAQTEAMGIRRRDAESQLGKALKRLLPACRSYRGRLVTAGPQVWFWEFGLLKDRRAEFERALGQPIDWNEAAGE